MITTRWAGAAEPEANRVMGEWCAARIGLPRPFPEPYTTMGVFDGSSLHGVILFNNYQPEAGVIEFHGAALSPRWLTRPVLREMFGYIFETVGCQMAVTRNSERNRRLHRVLKAYGFIDYPIPRLRGRDEGEIVWTLTDDAWRQNGFD